jgi:hypothetical protein
MNIKIDDSISEGWGLCKLNIRIKLYSIAIAEVIGCLLSGADRPFSIWVKFYMLLIFFYDREIMKRYLAPKSLKPMLIFSIAVLSWFIYIFMELRNILTIINLMEIFMAFFIGMIVCYIKRQNAQEVFATFLVVLLASTLCMTSFGIVLLGTYSLLYFCKKRSIKRYVVKTKEDFRKFCDKVPCLGTLCMIEYAAVVMPLIQFRKTHESITYLENSMYLLGATLLIILDSELYLKWTKKKIANIGTEE